MINLKLYRHKYYKDIYLARNWGYVGGNHTTPFYFATKELIPAITDANKPDFRSWMNSFLDEEGKTKLKAKITLSREIEFDGYKGICCKELELPVTEFECVEFVESEVAI